jgi:hypothetical protein
MRSILLSWINETKIDARTTWDYRKHFANDLAILLKMSQIKSAWRKVSLDDLVLAIPAYL